MILIALAMAAVAAPSAEAVLLGRQIAEAGTLAALLPSIKEKDAAELLAEAKNFTEADKAKLSATADRVFAAGRERLLAATGRAYAERLNVADLKVLAAFHRSGAAKRAQAALPAVIAASMKSVGAMDFKHDVRKAFCAETGKLCPTQ